YPTPTIGMVGLVEDLAHVTRSAFQGTGDAIVLLGRNTDEIGGSEYLRTIHGLVAGDAPALDLETERSLQQALLEAIRSGLVRSAHDCSDGGLAVALVEGAIGGDSLFGIDVELADELPEAALLFGETQSRVVVSTAPETVDRLLSLMETRGVPAARIGTVGEVGGQFRIRTGNGGIDAPIQELALIYERAIPRRMEGTAADVDVALHSEVALP